MEKIVDGFLSFYGEGLVFNKKVWKKMKLVKAGMKNYLLLSG